MLKIKIIAHSDNGQSDPIYQEYTDAPFLATAMKRTTEILQDYYTWNVPDGVKWQKLEIVIECIRK